MPSRGMGAIAPRKVPRAKRRGDEKPVIGTGKRIRTFGEGGSTSPEKVEDQRQKEYAKRNPQYATPEPGAEPVYPELALLLKKLPESVTKDRAITNILDDLLHGGSAIDVPPRLRRILNLTAAEKMNESSKYAKGGKVKSGLYENIHKKRARIAAGSGEKMRTPGTRGAPTAQAFRQSAKTAKR